MNRSTHFLRSHLPVYLLYLAIATLITWPLATVLTTRLAGDAFSDAYELTRHIWWIKHALQTGQPVFFQPLLAYPDGLPGAWLWGNPLQSFPAWLFAFFLPLPAAYNLMVLLRLALNGWAMYRLALHLTEKPGAALLAGLVFMIYPTFQGQLSGGHAGLLAVWPLPLYVYTLLRLRETGNRRWLALSAALFVISLWGSILLLVFMLLPITALLAAVWLAERDWATLRWLVIVVALGGAASLVFILPVLLETLNAPEYVREVGGFVRYSAEPLTILTPSFYHPVFTHLEYTHRVLGISTVEGPGYVGVIAGLLVGVAVWRVAEARRWLALAAVAWILSLGPLLKYHDAPVLVTLGEYETYIPLPFAILQNTPVLNIARTPARFNFTVALAVAVMTAYGVAHLSQVRGTPHPPMPENAERKQQTRPATMGITPRKAISRYGRGLALFLLMVGVVWEYRFFWPEFPTIDGTVPAPVAALAERDDVRAVFDIPWSHLLADKDGLFLQTGHQHPMIAGHVTRRTPVDPAKLTILQETLDPALLDAAGVDVIILHKRWDDEEGATEAFIRRRLGMPFYEDEFIALFEAPATDALPRFTAVTAAHTEVTDQAASYLYAPEPGWAVLAGRFQAAGRQVAVYLDGTLVQRLMIAGTMPVTLPLPITEAGYHTVTLAVEPPCPQHFNPTLACRSLQLTNLRLDNFTPDDLAGQATFERGLRLGGAHIPSLAQAGETLPVWLWWMFDEARAETDVRFVHVLDADGNLVAQADRSLGEQPAGGQWAEAVEVALPDDLAAGTYRVYVGWYTYPDITRFAVLSSALGTLDNRVYVGEFTLVE